MTRPRRPSRAHPYPIAQALTEEKSAFQKRAGSGGVTFESQPAAAMQHIVDAIRACGAEGVFLEEDALRLDKEFRAHSKPSKTEPTKRVLTADGFRQVCSRMGLHEPRLVDHLFKQWDSDGSGEIDFQEFMHAITFVRTGSSADKIVILFRIMDVDDDGCVSRVELARFLTSVYRAADKPKPPSKIQEQVDKLFGHLDKDHSENISLEGTSRERERGKGRRALCVASSSSTFALGSARPRPLVVVGWAPQSSATRRIPSRW